MVRTVSPHGAARREVAAEQAAARRKEAKRQATLQANRRAEKVFSRLEITLTQNRMPRGTRIIKVRSNAGGSTLSYDTLIKAIRSLMDRDEELRDIMRGKK
jgi:hypothetical protein